MVFILKRWLCSVLFDLCVVNHGTHMEHILWCGAGRNVPLAGCSKHTPSTFMLQYHRLIHIKRIFISLWVYVDCVFFWTITCFVITVLKKHKKYKIRVSRGKSVPPDVEGSTLSGSCLDLALTPWYRSENISIRV